MRAGRWLLMSAALASTSMARENDDRLIYGAHFEEFEYRTGDNAKLLAWDGGAFVGNDDMRAHWFVEGEYDMDESAVEHLENRAAMQWPVSDFFDVKAGVRLDYFGGGKDRWYAVLGATGLAPQWFESDIDLFVGEGGRTSLRLDAEYELLLSNHLILIASGETTYAFAEDTKAEIGRGFTGVELGLRLSYDLLDRSVSPYIGAVYETKYGDTAEMAHEGEDTENWFFVAGVKLML